MARENQPLLYLLDLDGVIAPTRSEMMHFANERHGSNIQPGDYNEDIARALGLSRDRTVAFLTDFYRLRMPHMPVMTDFHLTLQALRRHGTELGIYTSRWADEVSAAMTKQWVGEKFRGIFQHVIHAPLDWAGDPLAVTRSKVEFSHILPRMPDGYGDDEPKHAVPFAEKGVDSVLFGDNPSNSDYRGMPNLTLIRDHREYPDYLQDWAARHTKEEAA